MSKILIYINIFVQELRALTPALSRMRERGKTLSTYYLTDVLVLLWQFSRKVLRINGLDLTPLYN